jgi:hypothetical protein
MEINEQGSPRKLRKPSLYNAWYLNSSSHGNWIYMMITAVVVVVVVMHASKKKILTLNHFAEDLIKFVHFFELENMILDRYGGFFCEKLAQIFQTPRNYYY